MVVYWNIRILLSSYKLNIDVWDCFRSYTIEFGLFVFVLVFVLMFVFDIYLWDDICLFKF
jgi:hypothetical protein